MTRLIPTPLFAMERELNEAQNRLRRLFGTELGLENIPLREPVGWIPKVEIFETDKELVFTAELPGMAKENLEINFENDVLTIQGEKKEEKEEKEEKLPEANGGPRYHLWERTYGAFRRTFILPKTVDVTKIVAEMKNGVLKIQMPKTEIAKPKGHKIEIVAK